MKICSFVAIKGGVGKTTLAYNYGEWLADQGYKILMLDFDLQCNLTQTYKIYNTTNTVKNIFVGGEVDIIDIKENISIIPGYMQLDQVESQLESNPNKNMLLYMWLSDNYEAKKLDQYDYVIIDCRPDFSIATKNATVVSHVLFSPIIPSQYGYNAKFDLSTRLEQFKKECIDYATRESYVTAKLVFLANMIKHNTKSSKELLDVIQGDPEVVSLFSEKELFNKTTLEMLPISEMEKDSQYNSHLKFFKETNLAFNNMKKCLDEDAK